VAMYPSEHAQVLVSDANAAAVTAWEFTGLIARLRPSYSAQDPTAALCSILQLLRDTMKDNAERHDSPAGKIPGGSLFNSRPTPLPDRIGTCRKHLALASQQILMSFCDST